MHFRYYWSRSKIMRLTCILALVGTSWFIGHRSVDCESPTELVSHVLHPFWIETQDGCVVLDHGLLMYTVTPVF